NKMNLQVIGEYFVTDKISDDAERRRSDHDGYDREAVEPVSQVHRISRSGDDENTKKNEERSEIDQDILEKRHGERGRERRFSETDHRISGKPRNHQFETKTQTPGKAFRRTLRYFQEVVIEPYKTV